jgi:hypothetical protein
MQGIQIHCSLWPGIVELKTKTDILTRSLCNTANAYGVLAATYIPEKDQPKNFYKNSFFSVPQRFSGGSGVVGPSGEYVAGPVYDQETIVYGDVDLAENDKNSHSINLAGIYSRWDLINLNVQQQQYEPVVPMEGPEQVLPISELNHTNVLEARLEQLEQQMAAFSPKLLKDVNTKD